MSSVHNPRKPLEGRVAIVTGAGEGIGRAIALELAARGARLVVTGESERALGETVGEIANAAGTARHVAGEAPLARAVERARGELGGLDAIVLTDARMASEARLLAADAGARVHVVEGEDDDARIARILTAIVEAR